ncbi:Pyridine nucleotide-disulfide oxidoreductase, FAD/NAD(P)-binding domain protein (plasmid) [Gemmatirosa kalamazoonensis]|uniref:NADH:ubiquinone reductase (non-electrogenic) n=1 Tax=Gemmatirosa kalamazoonensis TaxID=861299 RepID=W0RQN1_9BACT|nr:FAD-dependent oxidoreductase [Gemmatirosa kalamazoonensis]AHG93026.1 Pyridine nucleotide-disulfide oxidoreductase, FAD/NAD(P)-binding domain protein [Gemmatirosa kalamazoonensis]
MSIPRVVIIGGGFAGSACAKALRERLPSDACEIVLFDRENHMVFHPLLPEVIGASLAADAVATPLRQMLPGVRCRTEEVVDVDLDGRAVIYTAHDGATGRMPFDHVVIACGRRVSLGIIPGMSDHAFPLKTVGDATALRSHVMQQLERADACDDEARRRWYLTFLVVGGGFSGVEAAGEINDLVRSSIRFFPGIRDEDVRVTLVHARDEILPEVSPPLRAFAAKRMREAGIELLLNAAVAAATPEGVWLAEGHALRGGTVVCTVGTSAASFVERIDAPKDRGVLLTDADMRLQGHDHAWALGDCARVVNALDGKPSPPTAQFALRQGRRLGENIAQALRGRPTAPFAFKPLGQLCSIGGHTAVAEVFGVRIGGTLAWLLWRCVYAAKLATWSKRVRVAIDWLLQAVFPRDLVHLKTTTTQRVSRACYQPGEFVFRRGDPATDFYVIERGEVEILDGDVVRATLGPGDFFGEMALLESRPRGASVRARTVLELDVVGRDVFTRMSSALGPLRDLVADAVRRRRIDVWNRLPAAHAALAAVPLSTFVEPRDAAPLRPHDTLADAIRRFADARAELCTVLDEQEHLVGVVRRPDLLRAVERLVAMPGTAPADVPVRDFMAAEPVTVARDASPLALATTLREHALTSVPVVTSREAPRVEGLVRAESLFAWLLDHAPAPAR